MAIVNFMNSLTYFIATPPKLFAYLYPMARTMIFIALFMAAVVAKAQQHPLFTRDTSSLQKKWFVTKYAGVSTGFMAWKGGSTTYLAAPLSYQLNKQVASNLFAFAGVSAVPYVFNLNSPMMYQPAAGKSGIAARNNNNYGISPAARIGMTYISNNGAFSVSGSISVSRSNYNTYSAGYMPFSPFIQ